MAAVRYGRFGRLLAQLDGVLVEAARVRDYSKTLDALNSWKREAANLISTVSVQDCAEFSKAGNFDLVYPGDFTTLEKEAHWHRSVLEAVALREASSDKGMSPKVDFAVISIRDDEYQAVLRRLSGVKVERKKHRTYAFGNIANKHHGHLSIAAIQTIGQGPIAAQDTARDAIEDLHPRCIALLGICGAVPDEEFTLGDVIVASRVHAFTLGAFKEGEAPQFSDLGGPMEKRVQDLASSIQALLPELAGWDTETSIGQSKPKVVGLDKKRNFSGGKSWAERTKKMLTYHFENEGVRNGPIVTVRPIGSSMFLMKDPEIIQTWQRSARHMAAVEMELAGVYEAARRMDNAYPILNVRGISDIVGFKRDRKWTVYACETAASFFCALVGNVPRSFL